MDDGMSLSQSYNIIPSTTITILSHQQQGYNKWPISNILKGYITGSNCLWKKYLRGFKVSSLQKIHIKLTPMIWAGIEIRHSQNSSDHFARVINKLTQLIDKKLHKSPTGSFNQNIDYAYNIRGWVTGINNADVIGQASDPSTDLFTERLSYNTVESGLGNTPLFNGNISAQVWNNGSSATPGIIKQGYNYAYDAVNRITVGDYKTFAGSWADATKYEQRGSPYDFIGNIKTLTHFDNLGATKNTNSYWRFNQQKNHRFKQSSFYTFVVNTDLLNRIIIETSNRSISGICLRVNRIKQNSRQKFGNASRK